MDFSFIILTRNPTTKKLSAIMDGDGETVAEFDTEEAATEAAFNTAVCKAWGFEVVEISGAR